MENSQDYYRRQLDRNIASLFSKLQILMQMPKYYQLASNLSNDVKAIEKNTENAVNEFRNAFFQAMVEKKDVIYEFSLNGKERRFKFILEEITNV